MNGIITAIPLLPLLGAVINGFFGRVLKEPLPGYIASATVGSSFVASVMAFVAVAAQPDKRINVPLWDYLSAGPFSLELGLTVDALSVVMMLIITGVGFLIHVYSIGYMHGDSGFSRYFSYLNLFIASMLVLVMGDSFFLVFVGWEGVGVCSFLLIGFWYTKRENPDAARKAFIMNRIGDAGFLLAMFYTFHIFGTLNIQAVDEAALAGVASPALLNGLGLLFLLAATGKSAQLPLHTWLPDAMAGPTPVSALIHAATMVTAGVYLIARAAPIFALAPGASMTIAWVGTLTALLAAVAATAQTDIKKILAYSTISQLGFMFVAVGAGAYWAGIFHVFTHAFFKALLFLGSGSVIHAMGGEQDVRKMGGLGKHMPVTGTTALIGTLAISGVPFLSGFYSKDAILEYEFNSELVGGFGHYLIYAILLFTAVLTAFYMFRWYYTVFAGRERFSKEVRAKLHESPRIMTIPLAILAFFSIVSGWLGLPEFAYKNRFLHWMENTIEAPVAFMHRSASLEWFLIILSTLAAGLGLGIGYWIYHLRRGEPAKQLGDGALANASRSGLGFDAIYRAMFTRTGEATSSGLATLDTEVVDKGLGSSVGAAGFLASTVRSLQTGYARIYALVMFLGVALMAIVVAVLGGRS